MILKNLKSLNRFHSANKTDNYNRGRKKEKNQKKLQKKSKYKISKCFSWAFAVSVLSLAGRYSPPCLPRMPSNTVLVSEHAVATAQTLIWSYSCVFLPPLSTEQVCFLLWELSMSFYIFHRQSLPSWLCGFNLQLVQLVGRFWVLFLIHTAHVFQLWFHLHLCMWVIHWHLLLGLSWRTWVCLSEYQVWKWCRCLGRRGSGSMRYSGLGQQEI